MTYLLQLVLTRILLFNHFELRVHKMFEKWPTKAPPSPHHSDWSEVLTPSVKDGNVKRIQ